MSVQVQDNTPVASAQIKLRASVGLRNAAKDMKVLSRPKTPFKTGDLANRGTEQVLGLQGKVSWDVSYAQYQERGSRSDGSHPIRNRPSGGQSHFAEESAEQVAESGHKYFGGL